MQTQDVIINVALDEQISSDDQDFIKRVQAEIHNTSSQRPNSIVGVTKIQNVPRIMLQQRKFEEDYYTPREMPIGPIYAEKENEEQTKLKLKLAAEFIKTTGNDCKELLKMINNEIESLKTFFDENLLVDIGGGGKLARMLLLDGCSVLQFIYSRVGDRLKEFQIDCGQAHVIAQDLFLMANQIPFRVLEILLDSLPEGTTTPTKRDAFHSSIDRFIEINVMRPSNHSGRNYRQFYKETNTAPVHLLHILRSALLYGFNKPPNNNSFDNPERVYFRNIQDLKTAGIRLESSESCCLRDITFSTELRWFGGRLQLPQLIVDDSTGRKLCNLVAYEMCPDNHNSEYGVTCYLNFLGSLIDSEEDVKDLRSAHILRNHLSSDAEVAKLFNKIGYNMVSDSVYRNVKQKIQRYCDSWRSKMAYAIVHGKGWPIVSLYVAILGLVFTALKTIPPTYPSSPPPL